MLFGQLWSASPFSAIRLRSSVVSVLISLISGSPLRAGPSAYFAIFARGLPDALALFLESSAAGAASALRCTAAVLGAPIPHIIVM
jgi:hypothetical protein